MAFKHWDAKEVEFCAHYQRTHPRKRRAWLWQELAELLGRSPHAVERYFHTHGGFIVGKRWGIPRKLFRGPNTRDRFIPNDVLAARDARNAAEERRDLTSIMCGDPPPGFSALYQRHER